MVLLLYNDKQKGAETNDKETSNFGDALNILTLVSRCAITEVCQEKPALMPRCHSRLATKGRTDPVKEIEGRLGKI